MENNEKYKFASARLLKDEYRELQDTAKRNFMSVSQYLRKLISDAEQKEDNK